jgi:hypothetical protein
MRNETVGPRRLRLSVDMTAAVKRWLYEGTEGFMDLGFH